MLVPINMGQVSYKDVLAAIDTKGLVKEIINDKDSLSKVLKCNSNCYKKQKSGNTIWYDDASTLTPKYALARDNGLLGVGMWSVDKLPLPGADGSDPHKREREEMWSAISNWNQRLLTLHTCTRGEA